MENERFAVTVFLCGFVVFALISFFILLKVHFELASLENDEEDPGYFLRQIRNSPYYSSGKEHEKKHLETMKIWAIFTVISFVVGVMGLSGYMLLNWSRFWGA